MINKILISLLFFLVYFIPYSYSKTLPNTYNEKRDFDPHYCDNYLVDYPRPFPEHWEEYYIDLADFYPEMERGKEKTLTRDYFPEYQEYIPHLEFKYDPDKKNEKLKDYEQNYNGRILILPQYVSGYTYKIGEKAPYTGSFEYNEIMLSQDNKKVNLIKGQYKNGIRVGHWVENHGSHYGKYYGPHVIVDYDDNGLPDGIVTIYANINDPWLVEYYLSDDDLINYDYEKFPPLLILKINYKHGKKDGDYKVFDARTNELRFHFIFKDNVLIKTLKRRDIYHAPEGPKPW